MNVKSMDVAFIFALIFLLNKVIVQVKRLWYNESSENSLHSEVQHDKIDFI